MIKLIDRIENKNYSGSKITIKNMVYTLYNEYKKLGILKGIAYINNTWYIK